MSKDSYKTYMEREAELLNRIAEGDTESYFMLGNLYCEGVSGEETNVDQAMPYWEKAAELGVWRAARLLGFHYYFQVLSGDLEPDVFNDYLCLTKHYLESAYAYGDTSPEVCITLGSLYKALDQREKAKAYYYTAANNKDKTDDLVLKAQCVLGEMLVSEGTKTSMEEGIRWMTLAYKNRYDVASEILKSLDVDMCKVQQEAAVL